MKILCRKFCPEELRRVEAPFQNSGAVSFELNIAHGALVSTEDEEDEEVEDDSEEDL